MVASLERAWEKQCSILLLTLVSRSFVLARLSYPAHPEDVAALNSYVDPSQPVQTGGAASIGVAGGMIRGVGGGTVDALQKEISDLRNLMMKV